MLIIPQCANCRFRLSEATCLAFLEEIPARILLNDVDHRAPVEGDNGIRYEPIDVLQPHPLDEDDEEFTE